LRLRPAGGRPLTRRRSATSPNHNSPAGKGRALEFRPIDAQGAYKSAGRPEVGRYRHRAIDQVRAAPLTRPVRGPSCDHPCPERKARARGPSHSHIGALANPLQQVAGGYGVARGRTHDTSCGARVGVATHGTGLSGPSTPTIANLSSAARGQTSRASRTGCGNGSGALHRRRSALKAFRLPLDL
jgi:hypothetical protein